MRKQKVVRYITLFVLISSLVLNYYLYEENGDFKSSKGWEYKTTVRLALFNIRRDDVDFWIESLQEKEDYIGLGRYLGELEHFSREIHRMNGKISVIGMAIDAMEKKYYELASRIRNGEDYQDQREYIKHHLTFIIETLEYVEDELNNSSSKHWYKEVRNHDSQLSQDVWDRFKEFEEKYLLKKAG